MEQTDDRGLQTARRRLRARVLSPTRPMRALAVVAVAYRSLGMVAASLSSSSGAFASGVTSDLVSLYYKLYWEDPSASNANDSNVVALPRGVPDDIVEKLQQYSLTFDTLPSLLQRAVLWDAGYVLSASDGAELATVFTDCERAATMADIALSKQEVADAQCSTTLCASAESEYCWRISQSCESAAQLESTVKCAVTSVEAVANTAMAPVWSTGSGDLIDRNSIPDLRVAQHKFDDDSADSILVIQSPSLGDQAQHNSTESSATQDQICAATSTLTFPCAPYSASSSARWCHPESSLLLTRWLREYANALGLEINYGSDFGKSESEGSTSTDGGKTSTVDDWGVAVNTSFRFDGQSSDIAQQFYRRHIAGDQVDPLTLSTLPRALQKTLEDVDLGLSDLPPLLQRALLWDSGYVFASDGALAQVYTACDLAMGDLAIPFTDIQGTGCITHTCSTEANSSEQLWRQAGTCNGFRQLANIARCAIGTSSSKNDVTAPEASVSARIWANGENDSDIPEVVMQRVQSNATGESPNFMYALRLSSSTGTHDVDAASCSSTSQFIIPCISFTDVTTQWCQPKPGKLVESWLQQVAKSKKSNMPARIGCIIGIPVAVITLLVASAFALRYRSIFLYRMFIRRRQSSHIGYSFRGRDKATASATVMTPDESSIASGIPSPQTEFLGENVDPFSVVAPTTGNEASSIWVDVINTMQLLLDSPTVCDSVIAFHDLKFHHLVGRGSCGEVWLCLLHDKRVTAKRLLKRRRKCTSGALESFANEILLSASLRHPHIVRYIGVASSALNNLWLVSEYMETGDLQQCLRSFGMQLSWQREKLAIAVGVTRALCYLHHDLHPAVVHGDLESRNVLLSVQLEAKLGDFGRSRRCERGMRPFRERSDGFCAPLWTAPEVLHSGALSPKADMYSLGVLLLELDSLAPPLQALHQELPPLQALHQELMLPPNARAQLSAECPPAVADLIARCLQREPSARPSAVDAVELLDALPSARLDTFSF